MANRRVLLLGVGLALAGSGRAQGQKALGELFSGDASVRGSILLRAQATEVLSGSQIAAGEGSAVLKLGRGGQLRICPKTNLSLSADAGGKALSLGLNAGAMELDYALESGADSLLTPDFRLQLIAPGSFHLAISVSPSGDTCLRSLPGNDAAVFVTEMMGNDSYQLSPGKNVLFRRGKISGAAQAPEVCGCPETAPAPTRLAENAPAENRHAESTRPRAAAEQAPAAAAASNAQPAGTQGPEVLPGASLPSAAAADPSTEPSRAEQSSSQPERELGRSPAPAAQPAVAHLEVESRFAYRGDAAVQDFYGAAARLSLSSDNSTLALALLPQVSGPAVSAPAAKSTPAVPNGGFLHRIGAALGHIFGR